MLIISASLQSTVEFPVVIFAVFNVQFCQLHTF